MNQENVVCSCSGVTVGDCLKIINETPDFTNMTFEDKMEELDIGQVCDSCMELDCDIIDTHYSQVPEIEEEYNEDY